MTALPIRAPNGRWAPRSGSRRSMQRAPLLWVLPGLALMFAFNYVAVGAGGWYAFTNWNGVTAVADFVGLANFERIIGDAGARSALVHTVQLAFAFVVIVNTVGLTLALALHRTLKSRLLLRAMFFAPVLMSPLAVAYVWQFMFDFGGPINEFLRAIGLEALRQPWTGSPTWALWTILVVMVWQFSGLTMTIYLAGLERIPDEVVEASVVDGSSPFQRLRWITLPLLAPAITIAVTLTVINGLRVFDQVMALTGGGPVGASETLATQVYQQTFVNGLFGYGAALSLTLTTIIGVVAVGLLTILRRREEAI